MCGLAAFVAVTGPPDPAMIADLFIEAGKRGPHASGAAVWRPADGWTRWSHTGALNVDDADRCAGGHVVVGHSRLATSGEAPGDMPPPSECQPFIEGGVALIHNGRVPGSTARVDSLDLLAVARLPLSDWPRQIAFLCGPSPAAIIYATPDRLIAYRHTGHAPAQPLFRLDRPEGVYLCSRSGPMNADAQILSDRLTEIIPARVG